MASVFDLYVIAGDLGFGPDDEPRFVSGLDAVVQDVRHRLLASGLVAELVAEDANPGPALAAIRFEVEADERIRPGSAQARVDADGGVAVTARTLAGATIAETLDTQG